MSIPQLNDVQPERQTGTPAEATSSVISTLQYVFHNPSLLIGLCLLGGLLMFTVFGRLLWNTELAYPLSAPVDLPPSGAHPFGTDAYGRDLLATMIMGTWLTSKVGLVAGILGVAFGTVLAFIAAYYGGWTDRIISGLVDMLLTVPGLLVLVVLAATLKDNITTNSMALIIAALAWREPTRQIRSQVLVMKEAPYVRMARLSGSSDFAIIFREMMPNLLPYIAATLVSAVAGAVLASVGLEALGLGARGEPTLGMTIYWLMRESAFLRGMWWWVLAPVASLILFFVGMYLVSVGLDEIANPKLRVRA